MANKLIYPNMVFLDSLTINVTDEDIEQCALISQGKNLGARAYYSTICWGLVDALQANAHSR